MVIPIEDLEFLKHLSRETMSRLDLEQPVAKPTELGANLPNEDGLSRFTAAGLRAARRRRGFQGESTYSNAS